MGFAKDLQRYGFDCEPLFETSHSVTAASAVVRHILSFLLLLDFRNGHSRLRRKYDGVKFALPALERLLYELAITDGSPPPEPVSKKAKTEEEATTPADLIAIKERMDHRDALREKLIKKCRDGQKAGSKQSLPFIVVIVQGPNP